MSGRAKGFMIGSCAGARVAGQDGELGLTYLPAHTINGKAYNQRVTFTVYINSLGRNGAQGRSDRFGFVAYGALADSICRSLSNGKAIDCVLKPQSYQGRSFDENRSMRLAADGSPIMVEKIGFQIIESPNYGEDSQKTIDLEVATGRRPVNWNVANNPDNATWVQMLKDRSNVQYVPGSATFGYARVLPLGQGSIAVTQAATGPAARTARNAARATGTAPPAATGTYVPPAAGAQAPPAGTAAPLAITQEQLALLVAQVTGQTQPGAGATPSAQGVDPKTGFPTASKVAGAAETNNVPF